MTIILTNKIGEIVLITTTEHSVQMKGDDALAQEVGDLIKDLKKEKGITLSQGLRMLIEEIYKDKGWTYIAY